MEFPDLSLEEIAEQLSMSEIQVLQYLKGESYLLEVREKIETQAPEVDEIISQYSRNQYVQQTVEIIPGLKASFRTLSPHSMDESLNYATTHRGDSQDNFSRILSRRRLSYALIDVNDEPLGAIPIEGSYFDMIRADPAVFKAGLIEYADTVYDFLSYYGLAEKLSEAFGIWENIVFNRLNGISDLTGTLKNSTRGSAKER